MSQKQIRRAKIQNSRDNKNEISGRPAGLTKSRKIIKTEKDKEVQFLKLCAQIRLNDFKNERADKQRNDRRLKRRFR